MSSSKSQALSKFQPSKDSSPPELDRFEKEWEQCLETIEKFEDRLDVLRRYGFTLVTGLLSADAVIWKVTGTSISTSVTIGAISSTGLLIVALWILDRDYQLYLASASERARAVEGILGYGLQRAIEYTYRSQRMWRYIQSLYWVFALTTAFIGSVVLLGEQFWPLWFVGPGVLVGGLLYIWLVKPRVWFFAYGASMNAERMQERIGRPIVGEHAILIGYNVEFNKRSYSNRKVGFANIVAQPEGRVQGALYRIFESDLWTLDGFEGYPSHYGREEVNVRRDNDETVTAQVYVASNPSWVDKYNTLKPGKEYLKLILGAKPRVASTYEKDWKDYLTQLQNRAETPAENLPRTE